MAPPDWDFRLSNNESSPATKSFQFTREKVKHLKSGEIDCGNGVMITYFDMLQEFSSYCFPTTNSSIGTKGTYFVQKIKYKGADGNQLTNDALPDIVCDIYWIGFFNSVEEIEAYEASLQ